MKKKLSETIIKLVVTGLLTSLVVVIYLLTMGLKIGPFNITFALIPIVVGAAVCGWESGTWLGLVFGAMVLLTGGGEPFFTINPFGTIVTVLVKGMAAGCVAGLVYKELEKKNRWAAAIGAAAAAPIVNTGVFLIGCVVFFMDTVSEWAGSQNVALYMFTGLAGVNFLVELGTNLVLSSAIVRIIDIAKKLLKDPNSQEAADHKKKSQEPVMIFPVDTEDTNVDIGDTNIFQGDTK